MGLTGKEVMLALAGFGVFLGIKKLRKFIYNHQGTLLTKEIRARENLSTSDLHQFQWFAD
jgi:hypothetical protein